MKIKIVFLAALLYTATTAFAGTPVRIDQNHSTVGFSVPILGGISQVTGKFSKFEIELILDEKDFTGSSIKAIIDVSSVDTGIAQRDGHLKTRDFFDVRKHPEILFESKRIEKTDEGYDVIGTLTMHGESRDVTLPLTHVKTYTSEKSGKTIIGFAASLTLNRDDYGITYRHDNPFFIGTDIEIRLNILTRSTEFDELNL